MLFNTDISIALKNFEGFYDLETFSIFETNKISENFTSLEIKNCNKIISFKVRCPHCGKYHNYKYSINEFIKKELIVGGCEILGLPLFYMGNYNKVNKKVSRHNNINKQLYAMI